METKTRGEERQTDRDKDTNREETDRDRYTEREVRDE